MLTALQRPSWQGQQAAQECGHDGPHALFCFVLYWQRQKYLAATGSCTATTGCCPRKSCAASTQRSQDRAHLRQLKPHWVAGLLHSCQEALIINPAMG